MGWLKTFIKGMATDKSSAYQKGGATGETKPTSWRDAYQGSGIGIEIPGKKFHGRDLHGDKDALEADILDPEINVIDKSFSLDSLIEIYYKERKNSPDSLNRCIELCKYQISLIPSINEEYISQQIKSLDDYQSIMEDKALSPKEYAQKVKSIQRYGWDGMFHSFDKLRIIYSQSHDYDSAIAICQQAKKYYSTKKPAIKDYSVPYWDEKIEKLKAKKETQK